MIFSSLVRCRSWKACTSVFSDSCRKKEAVPWGDSSRCRSTLRKGYMSSISLKNCTSGPAVKELFSFLFTAHIDAVLTQRSPVEGIFFCARHFCVSRTHNCCCHCNDDYHLLTLRLLWSVLFLLLCNVQKGLIYCIVSPSRTFRCPNMEAFLSCKYSLFRP